MISFPNNPASTICKADLSFCSAGAVLCARRFQSDQSMENKPKPEQKNVKPGGKLKPSQPDTKGAPNDKDPQAQYENKDES